MKIEFLKGQAWQVNAKSNSLYVAIKDPRSKDYNPHNNLKHLAPKTCLIMLETDVGEEIGTTGNNGFAKFVCVEGEFYISRVNVITNCTKISV